MKIKSLIIAGLLCAGALLTGCATNNVDIQKLYAENGVVGYRTTVRQRGVGLWAETPDPTTGNGSVKLKAGFFSSSVEITPVATVQTYEANHFDTFESAQSGFNPFSFSYNETSGSGFVATTNGGGSAIIPKAGKPLILTPIPPPQLEDAPSAQAVPAATAAPVHRIPGTEALRAHSPNK